MQFNKRTLRGRIVYCEYYVLNKMQNLDVLKRANHI